MTLVVFKAIDLNEFSSFLFRSELYGFKFLSGQMIGLIVLLTFLTHLVIGTLSLMPTTPSERDSTGQTAPWYSVEGLQDIANLHDDVIDSGYEYTVEALE